jgi:hypothetical protein
LEFVAAGAPPPVVGWVSIGGFTGGGMTLVGFSMRFSHPARAIVATVNKKRYRMEQTFPR